ncbi:MAG: NTP transferase domain-containing protein [Deltaproteobacteria bacterium]|nr:NTP transferase domain-containing protein [Deltaproteobacteria bacterium]
MDLYGVIMAGGRGTRFWPLSREKKPKHLLAVTGERTILQQTVDRLLPLAPEKNLFIITAESHAAEVRLQLPSIPQENIIIEPVGRNTAPCIGLAALHVKRRDPKGIMIVLPSDHLIADAEAFRSTLAAAAEAARRAPCLAALGIAPTAPETGYGYIEEGKKVSEALGHPIHRVLSFREKPDRAKALAFLESGAFFWNSGVFVWSAETILEAIAEHLPLLAHGLKEIDAAMETNDEPAVVREVYERLTPISIDYGVMEKTKDAILLKGSFGWSDIGSWDALCDMIRETDKCAFPGKQGIAIDARECYVRADRRIVALVGVEDLIVVDSEDALLICRRGRSQDVKKVVEELEKRKLAEYL